MPRDFSRSRRVEEQLRRELSDLIRHEIKEPGLGLVSVAEVRITADLSQARVYISVLEDDPEKIEFNMKILRDHIGKLRGQLGKRMHIRAIPQLEFIHDDLVQKSSQLDHLIDQAIDGDRRKASDFGTDTNEDETSAGAKRDDHG